MEDWLVAWRQAAAKSEQLLAAIEPAALPKEASVDQERLLAALAESAEAMAAILARARGKVSGFRGAPTVFVAYLVAHEAYHWGEVGALLAQQGERLPRELAYGLWDWGDVG